MEPEKQPKKFVVPLLLIIIVVLLIVIGFQCYSYKKSQTVATNPTNQISQNTKCYDPFGQSGPCIKIPIEWSIADLGGLLLEKGLIDIDTGDAGPLLSINPYVATARQPGQLDFYGSKASFDNLVKELNDRAIKYHSGAVVKTETRGKLKFVYLEQNKPDPQGGFYGIYILDTGPAIDDDPSNIPTVITYHTTHTLHKGFGDNEDYKKIVDQFISFYASNNAAQR